MINFVLHASGAACFGYALYYEFMHVHVPAHLATNAAFVAMKSFPGKWKYLTIWDIVIQFVYHSVALVNDFAGSSEIVKKRQSPLQRFRDGLFASWAFPVGLFVSATFWGLYTLDRELVFPVQLDLFYPNWLNHCVHTGPILFMFLELFLVPKINPSRSALAANLGFTAVYLTCISSIIIRVELTQMLWCLGQIPYQLSPLPMSQMSVVEMGVLVLVACLCLGDVVIFCLCVLNLVVLPITNNNELISVLMTAFLTFFRVVGFVGVTFWAMFFVDREMVFPEFIDTYFPAWLNHAMHSAPPLIVLCESVLVFHSYPHRLFSISFLTGGVVVYLSWITYVHSQSGVWAYPILQVLNNAQRGVFFGGCTISIIGFYFLGEKLNKLRWIPGVDDTSPGKLAGKAKNAGKGKKKTKLT